jgi:hypothetical protein
MPIATGRIAASLHSDVGAMAVAVDAAVFVYIHVSPTGQLAPVEDSRVLVGLRKPR